MFAAPGHDALWFSAFVSPKARHLLADGAACFVLGDYELPLA
jgi:hypothetical protein